MRRKYDFIESGVTLIELMVTVLVVAIIIVVMPVSFRSGTGVWEKGDSHAEVMQNALIGMDEMVRELKQAKSVTKVSAATDTTGFIQFESSRDSNSDGNGDPGKFQYVNEYLKHDSQYDPNAPNLNSLSGPLDSLKFTCYEADDVTPTTDPEEIKSVLIQMDTKDENDLVNDIPLCSKVYIGDLLKRKKVPEFAIFGHTGIGLNQVVGVGGPGYISNIGSNGDMCLYNGVDVYGDAYLLGGISYQYPESITIGVGPDHTTLPNYDPFNEYFIELPCPTTLSFTGEVTVDNNYLRDLPIDDVYGYPILPPGTYGQMYLGSNQELIMTSGNYYFESITAKNLLTIIFDVRTSAGPPVYNNINVFVKGRVEFGNSLSAGNVNASIMGGEASQVYWEIQFPHHELIPPPPISITNICEIYDKLKGSPRICALWIGKSVVFKGTIYAPYGHISLDSTMGEGIEGAIYSGTYVAIHNASIITYAPSNYMSTMSYDCN